MVLLWQSEVYLLVISKLRGDLRRMRFSSKIEKERHEPWAAHYLNYALLKRKQHDIEEVQDKPGHEHVFEARKHMFQVWPPGCPT